MTLPVYSVSRYQAEHARLSETVMGTTEVHRLVQAQSAAEDALLEQHEAETYADTLLRGYVLVLTTFRRCVCYLTHPHTWQIRQAHAGDHHDLTWAQPRAH